MSRRAMKDTKFIRQSAQLLYDLTVKLLESLEGYQPEIRGLHTKYLILYLLYTIRQVQAICLLVGNNKLPYYSEQAGQLVRVLYEIFAKSSWMVFPDKDNECNRRAWRLEKASVYKETKSEKEKQEICKLLGITEYEHQTCTLKQPPTIKDMLKEIGQHDINLDQQHDINYSIYSHESSAVHASFRSMIKAINYDTENRYIKINADSVNSRALRLTTTLVIFNHILEVIIPSLGIQCEKWENIRTTVWHEIIEMLNPLINQPNQ